MYPAFPEADRHPRCAWVSGVMQAAGFMLALLAPAAVADIFRLTGGGIVEGQLLARDDRALTVRTTVGTVILPLTMIDAVEAAPSPFDEYDLRLRTLADTPEAQTDLAAWCGEHDLATERRKHLLRAIELNPDFAAARAALGFVRVGAAWVDGRALAEPVVADRTPENEPATEQRGSEEKLAAAVQANWHRRIRGIRVGMLESPVQRREEDGRRQILEIRDPLAILPMSRVLGASNRTARAVLVEALSAFPQDEATLNLAVIALTDASSDIRQRALAELVARNDTRVGAQFRKALDSDNDELIRRAAIGLGELKAVESVPDLIDELTVRRVKRVQVPVRTYFGDLQSAFSTPTETVFGNTRVTHAPQVGLFDPTAGVTVENVFRMQQVTVYRTEVLEALKLLTGQNFGFDAIAWRTWYEEQKS